MSLRTSACVLPQKLHMVMLLGRAMSDGRQYKSTGGDAKDFMPVPRKFPESLTRPLRAAFLIGFGGAIRLTAEQRSPGGNSPRTGGAFSRQAQGGSQRWHLSQFLAGGGAAEFGQPFAGRP